MSITIIAEDYEFTIPEEIRQSLKIKPGDEFTMIAYGKNILLVPRRPISEARGSLKGIDTDLMREKADREI